MSKTNERINPGPDNTFESAQEAGQEQQERLRERHETAGEVSPERNEDSSERARVEALETAVSIEKKNLSKEKARQSPAAARRGGIGKSDLNANYKRTMTQVQSELSGPSRTFSKIIHNKTIEKVSDTLESTIARPNAILAGAFMAFVFTLALYLIAKNFGYRLSGFETIGGFILGWIVGILFDYFKVMITGKRS